MMRGISSGSVTRKLCLVIGIVMPRMSASWKASVPIERRADLAGDGHDRDGVHVGVGQRGDQVGGARPDVAMHTPTRPVAAAYPWAAWPAPCSWRTRMWRIVESISGSYAGRMAPPGMPKMSVVPAASSDLIRLCAPVTVVSCSPMSVGFLWVGR